MALINVLVIALALSLCSEGMHLYRLTKPKNRSAKSHESLLRPREYVKVRINEDELITARMGSRIELECESSGNPLPYVEWRRSDRILSKAGFEEQNSVSSTGMGKLKSRLVIDCVMPHHQGSYTCSAFAGSRSEISSTSMLLADGSSIANWTSNCKPDSPRKPRITVWSPALLELSGNDVTLPCAATGYPEPDIYWIDNQTEQIIDSDSAPSQYRVTETGDLFIPKITWNDMGSYTCVAQNSEGEDKIDTFLYPVKHEEE